MTENPIHRLLNPGSSSIPPSLRVPNTSTSSGAATQRPVIPTSSHGPGGGSGTSEMDPTALRNAAKRTADVESHIHTGARIFPPDTDQAAGALGNSWATAAAMKQTVSQWTDALKRLADEVNFLGSAVEKCADNRVWAEEENKQRIMQIRTGAR